MPCFCGGFRAKKQKKIISVLFVFSHSVLRKRNTFRKEYHGLAKYRELFTCLLVMLENSLEDKFLCYLPYVGPGYRPFSKTKPGNDAFLLKKARSDRQPWSKSSFIKGLVARCHSFWLFTGTVVNTFIQYIYLSYSLSSTLFFLNAVRSVERL
jgi:hypothetical protein